MNAIVKRFPLRLDIRNGGTKQLLKQQVEVHQTPAGKRQDFIYCLFQRSSR